ncbi:TPA: hypothetical protein TUX96_001437, partial [Streptococcus equi subsp. zooepidemicus]|nr:hypothetical protein [Streptococcus equi subsp. zooepidemicus]
MNNPSDILKFFLSMTTEEFLAEFSLANDKMEEYSKKLAFFMEENDSKSITKLKGNALENLVVFLAQNTNLFEVIPNVRTSTNEIDALLRTKIQAKPLLEKHLDIGTDILFECKNYNQKVSVTWVGKFHSLLRHQSCKFGIIFSFHG